MLGNLGLLQERPGFHSYPNRVVLSIRPKKESRQPFSDFHNYFAAQETQPQIRDSAEPETKHQFARGKGELLLIQPSQLGN